MLVLDEGNKLKPYRCPSGKLTIGIGHNLEDKGLTPKQVNMIYEDDVAEVLKSAINVLGRAYTELSSERKCVILSMIFQMGEGGFGAFKKMIVALQAKDFDTAAAEMLNSKWAKQTPARASRLANMMRTNEADRYYLLRAPEL